MNIFIGVVLSIFVVCLVCVVNLAVCLCRSNQLQQQHRIALHQSTATLAHPASYTGEYECRHLWMIRNMPICTTGTVGATLSPAQTRYATLPLEKLRDKPPPPYPGNHLTPATSIVTNSMSHNHVAGHHMVVSDGGTNGIINGVIPVQQVVYYSPKWSRDSHLCL